jgi:predicted ArsR family transcriptional regulator
VAQRRGRPVEETRRLAAELAASQPDATTDDLAKQLGISTQRLKRVLSA